MGGICPYCEAELRYIREFQKADVCYEVSLSEGNISYEKQDDYDCAADWGCAECPECGEELPGINDEFDALSFLKGELKLKKR
jgi:hypothetical protein